MGCRRTKLDTCANSNHLYRTNQGKQHRSIRATDPRALRRSPPLKPKGSAKCMIQEFTKKKNHLLSQSDFPFPWVLVYFAAGRAGKGPRTRKIEREELKSFLEPLERDRDASEQKMRFFENELGAYFLGGGGEHHLLITRRVSFPPPQKNSRDLSLGRLQKPDRKTVNPPPPLLIHKVFFSFLSHSAQKNPPGVSPHAMPLPWTHSLHQSQPLLFPP